MRISPGWKTFILLGVIAAHGWLGWQLANYRPDGRLAEVRSPLDARADELVLVLSFEARVAPATRPTRPQPPRARRRLRDATQAMVAEVPGPGPAVLAAGAAHDGPLDLRAPPVPDALPARADPFARVPTMRHHATRFDRGWQSDGNLTRIVARRSMVAGVLLGAMGALRKPCTERERREYDAACVPGQYEHVPEEE